MHNILIGVFLKLPQWTISFLVKQQLVSHCWRLFKYHFYWGLFCNYLLFCFIFPLEWRGYVCNATLLPPDFEWCRQTIWISNQFLVQNAHLLLEMQCCFIFKFSPFHFPYNSSPPKLCLGYEYSDEPWCDYTVQLLMYVVVAKEAEEREPTCSELSRGFFSVFSPNSVALWHMQMSLLFFIKP